jgi:hypothetical protein
LGKHGDPAKHEGPILVILILTDKKINFIERKGLAGVLFNLVDSTQVSLQN